MLDETTDDVLAEDQRVADEINEILEKSGRTQVIQPQWALIPGTNAFGLVISVSVQKKLPPKIAIPGEAEREVLIGNAVRGKRFDRMMGNGGK